jgi:hypothetical protein
VRRRHEPFGLIAEFEDAVALLDAAKGVREAGYTRLDAFSPFPLEGLARAIGFRERWLPFIALAGGAVGSFELMVLGAVVAVLGGMLALNRLPRLYHPVSNAPRFERVTVDRFFLLIESGDPYFHEERTPALLERLGAVSVEEVPQ